MEWDAIVYTVRKVLVDVTDDAIARLCVTEEFSQIEGIGKKNIVASSDKLSNSVCLINVLQETNYIRAQCWRSLRMKGFVFRE